MVVPVTTTLVRLILHPHRAAGKLVSGRYVMAILLLLLSLPVATQQTVEPVFPAERHRELMEELDYSPPAEEEEEEKEEPDSSATDWSWEDWDWGDWSFDFSQPTTYVILLVLIALIGFLVYRMLGDVSLRKRTREAEEEDRIDVDDIEEERLVAEGVSLSLLERAERAGQFDVAVRLLYIQLLKELQDAGLIKYRKDFSNRDYQNQLIGQPVLPDFRAVTVQYERYWFGKYPIDRLSYRNAYQGFTALNERIRSAAPTTTYHG